MEKKYPDLFSLSSKKLEAEVKSYSVPLVYFSFNIETGKVRGLVIADQAIPFLAKKLLERIINGNILYFRKFRVEGKKLK